MQNCLPLVTIAIPTYNRADSYLRKTIESALAQTYPHVEILVSDNASTDGTPALVRSLGDARLRYSRLGENIGANRNYNRCLEQASGDYFLLLHDDDLIDRDFVSVCLRAVQYGTAAGLIRTGIRVIDNRGKVLRESRNQTAGLSVDAFFRAWFAGKTSWYLASTLFNTKRLRQVGGFHSTHQRVEDGFVIAQLAARCQRVDVEEIKASFRVHRGELTFDGNVGAWGQDYLELLACLCELVPPDKAPVVRKEGMRFFARLTYNRAGAIETPVKRAIAYMEICKLFHYRYLPTHRIAGARLIRRTLSSTKRRAVAALHLS